MKLTWKNGITETVSLRTNEGLNSINDLVLIQLAGMEFVPKDKLARLEDMLFTKGAMFQVPCFCCGYNGAGYFQPDSHPCAERHHRLLKRED